jgi:hypothetical protein
MYHPLLDDLYNIPPPNKINKFNNTKNQTHWDEKETQPDINHITQKDTTPMPFALRPLPYPNPSLTTKPLNTHIPINHTRNQRKPNQYPPTYGNP